MSSPSAATKHRSSDSGLGSGLSPTKSGRRPPAKGRGASMRGMPSPASSSRMADKSGGGGGGGGDKLAGTMSAGKNVPGHHVHRIVVDNDNGGAEMRDASAILVEAATLRNKYKSIDRGQVESDERLDVGSVQLQVRNDGVIFFEGQTTEVVPWEEFYDDVTSLYRANGNAACIATCNARLQVLEEKYRLHCLLNSDMEERVGRNKASGGLFSTAMRVDNCVRLMAGMNAQSLVNFIRVACEVRANDNVRVPEGGEQSLQQLLDTLDISATDASQLTVEGLGLHPAGEKRFIRFDAFDPDVNKGGKAASTLLQVFLQRDTTTHGRFFADLVRPLMFPQSSHAVDPYAASSASPGGNLAYIPVTASPQADSLAAPSGAESSISRGQSVASVMNANHDGGSTSRGHGSMSHGQAVAHASAPSARQNQATEYTLVVEGRGDDEWASLARWVQMHKLANPRRNTWVIEIPRIASKRKDFGFDVQQQQLEGIFLPLFLASRSPEDEKYSDVAWLLNNVGAFTIRSDEDTRTGSFTRKRRPPGDVPWNENVCDLYFAYYFWANLVSLNAFRRRRGMNTLEMRANAGERSTQLDSLMYSFLLSDSISHGVLLDSHPVLQYLYGMNGIGVAMSPLTNNATDIEYVRNPFHRFFIRSLKVTLCTDSPLHYHDYDDPLLEEYSTAAKMFRLTPVDVSELSRTSILVSAFPSGTKATWLGTADWDTVNVQAKTGVPDSRVEVRHRLWDSERLLISNRAVRVQERRRASAAAPAGGGNSINGSPKSANGATPIRLSANDDEEMTASLTMANSLLAARGDTLAADEDPISEALRLTAKEAEELAAVHGFAAGSKFRLLPGGLATEKLAVYVTVDKDVDYPRIKFVGPTEREGVHTGAAKLLRRALETRRKFILPVHSWSQQHRSIETAFDQTAFDEGAWEFGSVDGVVVSRGKQKVPRLPPHIASYSEFVKHLTDIKELVDNVHVKKLCNRRLQVLEDKFRLHHAVSHSVEASNTEDKASSNRDFYQTCKVDTNVRMENGMTARQLLNFILAKAHSNADDIVCHREGQEPQTLRQLLSDMSIDPEHLTVDDLNVQADTAAGINRLAFTPEGRDQLLTLLLKTDNEMKGRYFAELTKLTFEQFKRDKFTFAENRLPIYGASNDEWDLLSSWFDTHGMACYNNQWMVQLPRIYSFLFERGKVKSFSQYIEHIFLPLWAVSLHPSQHPRLFHFLNHVSGFDCVEDERIPEAALVESLPAPQEWTTGKEPPYNYYLYYLWANIRTLNEFRLQRSFSTFSFRPSCGEAGSIDHMLGGFLVANGISYGINLRLDPAVQYLYYLAQIGIAVSPLSNNTKLLEYLENPFPEFFRRGLDVSLSTDSPLQYHHTQEPLIEEYSIASKVWKLSPTDMCEIARNSVRQSGFSHEFKKATLGPLYFMSSSRGNDESKTHLSSVRVAYRWETYHTELSLLEHMTGESIARAMLTADDEASLQEKLDQDGTGGPAKSIIAASTDEAAMSRLRTQRDDLALRLSEVQAKLEEQREHHRLMSDRYHDATAREAQLIELRKTRKAELEAQVATMQAAANMQAAAAGVGGQMDTGGAGPSLTGAPSFHAGGRGLDRASSFATNLSRRMSQQSFADLARVQSIVATTHFEGSTNEDGFTEHGESDGSPVRHGSRSSMKGQPKPAVDFRTGSETPWTSGPMFTAGAAGEQQGAGGAGAAGGGAAGARGNRRNQQGTHQAQTGLDDDIAAVTRNLVGRMMGPASSTMTPTNRATVNRTAGAQTAPAHMPASRGRRAGESTAKPLVPVPPRR